MKTLLLAGVLLVGGWLFQQSLSRQNNQAVTQVVTQTVTNLPAQPIKWGNLTNIAVSGDTLRKIGGRNDSPDAKACSSQKLTGGDSYLEFVALETDKDRYIGLSTSCDTAAAYTLDFALHLTTFPMRGEVVVEVREKDVYKAETTYSANTVLRIALEQGAIKYYKNAECFYVSQAKPRFPLAAAAFLVNLGATVAQARLVDGVTPNAARPVTPNPPVPSQAPVVNPDATLARLSSAQDVMAGIRDDQRIYWPADYTTFLPPPVGVRYADTVFGTYLTRLSDGLKQFNDAVRHEYATMSPFNLDSSLILLGTENQGYFIVDRQGKIIAPPTAVQLGGSSEPRWSGTEPGVLYFHEGNQLKKFDVFTRRKSLVRAFTQYQHINFGGGESDLSEDGNYLVLAGDNRYVWTYALDRNAVGKTVDFQSADTWDAVYLTANNNVMIRWNEEGPCPPRAECKKGMVLYDKDMNFLRQVLPFGGHSDQGRDLNGDEILWIGSYRDPAPPPGCENSGVAKVRISDSRKSCVLALHWGGEMHVSSNSNGKNPWVLVSFTDTAKGTAEVNHKLPPDWRQRWNVRFNELILFKADGSEYRRLAHHRSRSLSNYWYLPRAALSKDGKYALFDSNFGLNPLPDYTDVFLVELFRR